MPKTKSPRRFVKERRRNACPACLDRNALTIMGHPISMPLHDEEFGPCQVCEGKGWILEVNPVGNEWRRYPWVISTE